MYLLFIPFCFCFFFLQSIGASFLFLFIFACVFKKKQKKTHKKAKQKTKKKHRFKSCKQSKLSDVKTVNVACKSLCFLFIFFFVFFKKHNHDFFKSHFYCVIHVVKKKVRFSSKSYISDSRYTSFGFSK